MKLIGDAAVAMWWNVADDNLAEFHAWHSREHLPERLAIPGFNRGTRWQARGGGDFFVIYELARYETLVSDAYLERLNNPTPWSRAMMPLHRNMVRCQCRVVASNGGGVAPFMTTVRLSPQDGHEANLDRFLRAAVADLPAGAGLTGAHLLKTETPAAAQTAEQRIRGADKVADWILLISGHDASALELACATALAPSPLRNNGALPPRYDGPYGLVHAVTRLDIH